MSTSGQSMDSFAVGDYVLLERSCSSKDFAALSPLSMIAGMVFPGEPALYLGHEVAAISPVAHDERIRYSARIEAVDATHRVLRLRVLGLRGAEVVLDATLRVQAQTASWTAPPALPLHKGYPATALVTGASGEIGSAVARVLAKAGWKLLLHDRGNEDRRRRLQESLLRLDARAEYVAADLVRAEGREALASTLAQRQDIALVVHAASPLVTARIEDLVAVNFVALQQIVAASLPQMLARQRAAVVLIGSQVGLPGWEAHCGAKGMAASLIDGIERGYATFGVRGFTVMPGLVASRFSQQYQADAPALLPQEVAEAILPLTSDDPGAGNVVALEPGSVRRGWLGFHAAGAPAAGRAAGAAAATGAAGDEHATGLAAASEAAGAGPHGLAGAAEHSVQQAPSAGAPLAAIVRRVLRLSSAVDLSDAALGVTPGWDSLRHIQLLLQIEAGTGIRFSSEELAAAHSFAVLDALCARKLAERASS